MQSISGPLAGAVAYKALEIPIAGVTDYWQLVLGLVILTLVLAFPSGLMGAVETLRERWGGRRGDRRP